MKMRGPCCAIEIDAQYARAYSMLACVHILNHVNGWGDPSQASLERAHELAQTAVTLDGDGAEAHWVLGLVHLLRREHDRAMTEARMALIRDPNFAWAHGLLGQVLHYAGRSQEAIQPLTVALRLDPNNHQDPHLHYLAQAYFSIGRYEEAAATLKRRIVCKPDTDMSRVLLAACYGHLGRVEEAKALWQEALQINPDYSLERRRRVLPYKDPGDFERVVASLRKVGLTE
jgi:adenylate cyclase